LLTTSLRGSAADPVIAASSGDGVTGLAIPPRAPPFVSAMFFFSCRARFAG
jgi:hypothetical protein